VGRRILVVEDDEPTRGLIELVLREGGYLVEHSRDGIEALERVKASTPDAIILDRSLPRLNGTEFAQAYRALPGDHAPIVAMCAGVDAPDWASSIGAAASIGKPFAIDDLLAAITAALAMTDSHSREPAAT
jgi:two-component system response regulator MprA